MAVRSDQQLKHNDCGISAVKSVLNFYNINIDRNYIAEQVPLDENGAWIQDIKKFFDQHEFNTAYTLLDLNSLKYNADIIKAKLPCILPVKNVHGLHYVVIYGLKGKKYLVLDPAKAETTQWSSAELLQYAYTTSVFYDLAESRQILQQMINEELNLYDIEPNGIQYQDETIVANKLTYFSYLKENYGFVSKENEKKFLTDLLYHLQINTLPNEFRSLKYEEQKLRIKTPVVLTVKKNDSATYKNSPPANSTESGKNVYIRLFYEMYQNRKMWYIYIFAALFAALITQLAVFSNQILIDNILPSYDTSLVVLFAVGFGLFKIFDLIIKIYKNFISIHLANIFDNYFLTTFIKKLNSFSIRYIHSFNRGDLTERMKDSLMLKTFFLGFFTNVLTDSFISVYSLIILLIIDWKLSMIILSVMIVFVIWFKIITPRIRENEKQRFKQKSALFSSLLENIDGLQVIKSFRLEYFFQRRIQPTIARMLKIQKKVRYINLANSSIINFIIIIATIIIIIFLSNNAIISHSITVGQIITFIALSGRIFSSLSNILDENLDLQENEIVLKRYFDFDNTASAQETNNPQQNKINTFTLDTIVFKNVCFEYVPQKPVLKNFNLSINKGEKIKIEGNNGVGKSTFCKILSMLYTPTSGDIYINNEKIIFYNQSALRNKMVLISNDDILFNDSLAFNLTFSHDSDVQGILELTKQIGFHDFIAEKEDGFDFVITEQGRNLSTGQRKKILILRALLSEAELIIIDEVLSGLDKESKNKIEQFINKEKNRAFILISHEPIENIHFDTVLNLNNGSLK